MRFRFRPLLSVLVLPLLIGACSSGGDGPVQVGPPVDLAAVTDLAVIAGSDSSVTLGWTSPATVAKAGLGIRYELHYTEADAADRDWDDWTLAAAPAPDAASGAARVHEVRGLRAGVSYVLALRATTGGERWSPVSNRTLGTAAPVFDVTRPARIRDLQQWAGTAASLTFGWTAAGDDSIYGTAAAHELRYATAPLTADNWEQALVGPAPGPSAEVAGMLQVTLTGLAAGTVYYCAVVATDDQGQPSALSNVAAATADDLRVIRVNVEGTGDYPTIDAAIFAARPGDLVLVGPGRYTWTNQGTGDPLHGMIKVERDWTDFEVRGMAGPERTILDAERQGNVMTVTGGFVTLPDGSLNYAGITVDGFTFTGGLTDPNAGGFVSHLSDSVVRNCIFTGNEGNNGGAIWIGGQGGVVVEDCLITGNTAVIGGGVMLINSEPRITLRRCTIRDNVATVSGGGLYAYHCTVTMEDCVLAGNVAGDKGGGLSMQTLNPGGEVVGCTIVDNKSGLWGSGVYLTANTELRLQNSIVAFNRTAPAFSSIANSTLEIGCSLVYGHTGGNSLPLGTIDTGGNLVADPGFCAPGSWRPGPGSPCLPANHPGGDGCGLIGALGPGCGGQ